VWPIRFGSDGVAGALCERGAGGALADDDAGGLAGPSAIAASAAW